MSSLLPELIALPVLFLVVLQLTFSHTIFSYIRLTQIEHKVCVYIRKAFDLEPPSTQD